MKRCVIFLPGALPPFGPEAGDILICADSGYQAARAMGLSPDLLVGDMDSISEGFLKEARSSGVRLEFHPQDKDRTDGEIALDDAVSMSPGRIVLIGGTTGRTDHVLSSFLLLERAPKGLDTELWTGASRTSLLRGPESKRFASDLPVASLIPLSSCRGVFTKGLKWPLTGDDLPSGSTIGVHNEPVSESFEVAIDEGSLLVIRCPLDQ